MGEDIQHQWDAVKAAPTIYIAAVIIVVGVIWWIVNHLKSNQIDSLQGRLALRDDEIADYKRQLAGASPDEARARIDALEQEIARLRPRQLSPEQIQAITLAARVAQGAVSISYDMAYADGQRMAAQMQRAFAAANWRVGGGIVGGPTHLPREGLSVSLRPDNERTAAETALLGALAAADLTFAIVPYRPHPHEPDQIQIVLTLPEA